VVTGTELWLEQGAAQLTAITGVHCTPDELREHLDG